MTSKTVTYAYKAHQIDAAIEQVAKDAKTLRQRIHNVAVAILMDWQQNSAAKRITDDKALEAAKVAVDRLNRLMMASPYHANAFAKWIAEMTPCLWSEETKAWYVHASDCRMMGNAFMAARDNPFWEVSPPTVPKPFDMWKDLQRIIDKARKHGAKPVEGDDFDPEAIRELTAILSKHEAASATS